MRDLQDPVDRDDEFDVIRRETDDTKHPCSYKPTTGDTRTGHTGQERRQAEIHIDGLGHKPFKSGQAFFSER